MKTQDLKVALCSSNGCRLSAAYRLKCCSGTFEKNRCLQTKRLFCNCCYDQFRLSKRGQCICGDGECKKEAELLERVLARREYNAAVWKAREEFDRQKLAEKDELAKQKELARQEKLARKAELIRQQKLARQADFDNQKALAEQELDGSLARQAELAEQESAVLYQ